MKSACQHSGDFRALLEVLSPDGAGQVSDPVQVAQAILANRAGRWLLVLDNVPDPGAAWGVLPAAGEGDILITTQAAGWPRQHNPIRLGPLPKADAVDLLTAVSGDRDREIAAGLAEELGGLPLGLAQAASYVRENADLGLAGYLALYRRRQADMHQEGHLADYPNTVATTWRLAFDQLSRSSRALLNLLVCYAPDDIPLDLLLTVHADDTELAESAEALLQPLLDDELHRRRAVSGLTAYSLVTRTGDGGVSIHRLVQAVTRHSVAPALVVDGMDLEAWLTAAGWLLSAALPQQLSTLAAAPHGGWLRLQTHPHALLDRLPAHRRPALILRRQLADWCGDSGDPARARQQLAPLVEEMARTLGADDPETLAARSGLAFWTGEAGDPQQARRLVSELLEDELRVRGPEHQGVADARGNLARWTGEAGDARLARHLYAELVDDRTRVLGPDHRYTLAARSHLADWTGEENGSEARRRLLAELVEDDARVLGPNDRDTLTVRAHLATSTGKAGDPEQARELYAELIEDRARSLGPDHEDALSARANFAYWANQAGNRRQALSVLVHLVEDATRVLGPHHQITLAYRTFLTSLGAPAEERPDGSVF